ncbi:MAG: DUF1475 family protein [Opitutaceae bacterium]
MIFFLRGLFIFILVSMLAVTGWAGIHCPLFAIPANVVSHPWFIATLFDAYWAFVTFYVWVAFKQTSWASKIAWFIAVILLGNVAMSAYCLNELFRIPRTGRMADVLTTKRDGIGLLGPILAVLGLTVTLLGLPRS